MIKELTIDDESKFLYLGSLIKVDFNKTNDLVKILDSDSEHLYGFYIEEGMVAFIYYSKSFDTIDIIDIVVDEEYRRKGIASELIKYVVDNNEDVNTVFLEVNERNKPAIKTYEKNGFHLINVRKKYYGREDALIMKRDV